MGLERSPEAETGREITHDIVPLALENTFFRREIVTGSRAQVIIMSIPPGEEIGEEVHEDVDQILFFVDGEGEAILDGERGATGRDQLVFVSAGTRHNFRSVGVQPLKVVTIYSPPEHPAGTVHRTKEEADAAEH